MASTGNKIVTEGILTIKDAFVVIVKTEWNNTIVDALEAGAIQELEAAGCGYKTIVVPGAFEIPFAIQAYAKSKQQNASAFIALGTVIRGDTPHFDYVCKAVTDGVVSLNLSLDVPTIFGVLTVDTERQAIERIGGIHGHKGEEAGVTAIKMIALNESLRSEQ